MIFIFISSLSRLEWVDAASSESYTCGILRLLKRKELWVPTWFGWVVLLAVFLGLAAGFLAFAHSFLSVNRPVKANVLVVEGWLPDYALEEAVKEFKQKGYEYLVAAGGPMPQGHLVSGYDTFARIAGATLRELQMPKEKLIEAPAAKTYKNRTWESAKAVRAKLRESGISVSGLNVVSEGPHARRTRLVYRKVFAKETVVGVVAVRSMDYDADRWWESSEGMKTTMSEGVGWLFESLFSSSR